MLASCFASCLQHACHGGKTTSPPPPPHTPPPAQGWGKKGTWRGAECVPPADKAAGWGGSRERVRDRPHDRARRELAPSKPATGGPPGVRTQSRKGDEGGHTANPPPCRGTRAAPRACTVLATCIRQRTVSKGAPPTPLSPAHPGRGEDSEGTARGHAGGAGQTTTPGEETGGKQWRRQAARAQKKKKEHNNAPEQGKKAETDGARQEPGSAERGAGKGEAPGMTAGRQGPTPQRTGGGRCDMSPQETLVRYPTSGVWGPPRCPYRPHLSARNKVGYARDRWPAARGGTSLGGWPMGLTRSIPHGRYCGSCPMRGRG